LIKRDLVLTAAHCISGTVYYYNNDSHIATSVEENEFFPTIASMYRVFAGAHDTDQFENSKRELEVEEIITVL
jgi:hypothetical protein